MASTLRAWHNRVGFLPRSTGGWRRYNLADVIAIRCMVVLTERGFRAAEAAGLVDSLTEQIKHAAAGHPSKIAIGKFRGSEYWVAEEIDEIASAGIALDFDDEFTIVLNLGEICFRLFDEIRRLRGQPPIYLSFKSHDDDRGE